jgi:hypothetical protein
MCVSTMPELLAVVKKWRRCRSLRQSCSQNNSNWGQTWHWGPDIGGATAVEHSDALRPATHRRDYLRLAPVGLGGEIQSLRQRCPAEKAHAHGGGVPAGGDADEAAPAGAQPAMLYKAIPIFVHNPLLLLSRSQDELERDRKPIVTSYK